MNIFWIHGHFWNTWTFFQNHEHLYICRTLFFLIVNNFWICKHFLNTNFFLNPWKFYYFLNFFFFKITISWTFPCRRRLRQVPPPVPSPCPRPRWPRPHCTHTGATERIDHRSDKAQGSEQEAAQWTHTCEQHKWTHDLINNNMNKIMILISRFVWNWHEMVVQSPQWEIKNLITLMCHVCTCMCACSQMMVWKPLVRFENQMLQWQKCVITWEILISSRRHVFHESHQPVSSRQGQP